MKLRLWGVWKTVYRIPRGCGKTIFIICTCATIRLWVFILYNWLLLILFSWCIQIESPPGGRGVQSPIDWHGIQGTTEKIDLETVYEMASPLDREESLEDPAQYIDTTEDAPLIS